MIEQADPTVTRTGSCRWAAASDVGKLRDQNEDTFLISPELALFLVSDGMGGHRGGALASKIVAEDLPVLIETRLNKLKRPGPRSIRSLFKKTIVEQSRQLRMEGTSETGHQGMGATLVILLLHAGRAYVANMGDSRAYRLRRGRLTQLTRDHSVVSELLREGRIDPDEAQNHSAQGQITHYIGMDEDVHPHVRTFELKRGDRFLLCTDGLTDDVDDKHIAATLRTQTGPQEACDSLVARANAAGGYDNITAVVVDYLPTNA